MNREMLKELGLEEEQINKVMQAHGEVINPLKQTKDSLQTEVDSYKEQITERDQQLETLKNKTGSEDELKSVIDSLKEANSQKDAEHRKLLNKQKLDYEVKLELKSAKARNEKAVKALLDLETVKINEDGKLIGLNEQLEKLKETDNYLFDTQQNKQEEEKEEHTYVPGSTQSGNKGKTVTDEEFGKSKYEELFGKKEEK